MVLLSVGNLGDLLIQAAFLQELNKPDVLVAVPRSYASVAKELFPNTEGIVALADRYSDGRWLATGRVDRTSALRFLLKELGYRYPGRAVLSLALTDDLIVNDRSLNIYEAYWLCFQRDRNLAHWVSPEIFPQPSHKWLPFKHLARWNPADHRKIIYICPWGGISLKNLPSADVRLLYEAGLGMGFQMRLLASTRDHAEAYPFFASEEVVRLVTNNLIRDASEAFSKAALVVAVDTAWYHLAALTGVPVMGIPGPRTLSHFEFPGNKKARSGRERLPCADCFSVDRCVVTNDIRCEARPDVETLVATMRANLTSEKPSEGVSHFPVNFRPPARIKRTLFRGIFRAMDTLRESLVFPLLKGRRRRILKWAGRHFIKD